MSAIPKETSMAQAKKKATPKKRKPAVKKQTKATPPKPQYEDVLAARTAWQLADERVATAKRGLVRSQADQSDFKARDLHVVEAQKVLANARSLAVEAKENFLRVKAAAR